MGDAAQAEMSRLHVHEEKACDAKLANNNKTARIAPAGKRSIGRRFEFQVPAISSEKLPFILHAVVVFTTIAPAIRDDDRGGGVDDDDLYRHFFNDHVRGVIERETLALAASMTMAEIFFQATTTSSSIAHHQLELKQFGRIIVYDACVYVKAAAQSVDGVSVSGNEDFSYVAAAAEDVGSRQTAWKVEKEMQGGSNHNQEGRPSKMDQIMGWACQSLKPQILQVLYGNDVTTDGNALVCISWLVLELATCLLIISFNQHYAFAILATLLLAIAIALLPPKLKHAADRYVLPSFTQDMIGDEEESPYLGHLLDLSQGIASFGGLITAIAGHFMVGPVNAVGFFFFCVIALGLYLSMVVTVGAVSRPHAKCLAIVVMVLVVITFIAACIPFVGHSGSKPQV